jgi:hypothetical protein
MSARAWSTRLFAAIGALLVLLGAVHLIALPLLHGWFVSVVGRASPTEPALILDHVISVPLLIALGVLTIHASRALRHGAAWARFACSTAACVVIALPIAVIAVVPADYLQGPAFALAIVILGIATLLTIVAVVTAWRD